MTTLDPSELTRALAGFVNELQADLDTPLHTTDLNAALLLHNLCEYLDLSLAQREAVLDAKTLAFVEVLEG